MCPSNIGTTIRCEVQLKIESEETASLNEICDKYHLNHHKITDDTIEVSNMRCFGLSEFDCVKTVYFGVKEIIRLLNKTNSSVEEDKQLENEKNEAEQTKSEPDEEKGIVMPEKPTEEKESPEQQMNSMESNGTYTKEDIHENKLNEPMEETEAKDNDEETKPDDNNEE